MPLIPRYSSQLALRTGTLTKAPSAVKVDPGIYGIEGRAMAGMGKAIAAVGEKMDEIQAKTQLARANTEAYSAFGQIEEEASQDKISDGFKEKYNSRLKETKGQILKTITNPRAKNQFNLEYDRDVLNTQFRINGFHNTLVIDDSKASFVKEKEVLSDKYYKASTPDEKQLVVDRMGARYDDMWKSGVMKKAQAAEKYKEWNESLPLEQAKYDADIDPIGTRQRLYNKEYGIKDVVQREALITLTKNLEERNTEQAQFALTVDKNQVEQTVAADVASGKITSINDLENIQSERVQMGNPLPDGYVAAARKLILSTKKGDDVLEAEAYNELTDEFYLLKVLEKGKSEASLLELTKFRIKMMDMLSEGRIEQGTYTGWLKKVEDAYNNKLQGVIDKGVDLGRVGWDIFNIFAEKKVPKADRQDAAMYLKRRFMDRIKITPVTTEDEVQTMTDEIILDYLQGEYPGYNIEDLEFTASETGLSIRQVYEALEKKAKEK